MQTAEKRPLTKLHLHILYFVGWVVGSLEILGNPAGLVRNIGTGIADLFRMPYVGLTRGPGAFVTGVTHGMGSLVKHISTGKPQQKLQAYQQQGNV